MKLLDSLRAMLPAVARRRGGQGPQERKGREDTDPVAWPPDRLHALLLRVLAQEHQRGELSGCAVLLSDGIRLQAEFIESVQLGPSHFKTFTRVHAAHAHAFPEALFEFQHAAGATVEAALVDGFTTWVRMDLLTLQDALREQPQHCTVIELPADETAGGRRRQVLLGPVGHLVAHPDSPSGVTPPVDPGGLFQTCRTALTDLLRGDRFLGIRLFASRDAHGVPGADCRVNGEPFAPGADCLQRDVLAWPSQGLEFRKQYLVVRTLR